MIGIDDAVAAGEKLLSGAIERIWPTPMDKAKSEAVAVTAAAEAAVATMKTQMSVMLAEAQSADKWTSRARPSFLYVMYAMILICIPFALVWAVNPATAQHMIDGMHAWLAAIPDRLYDLFETIGLGYFVSRTVEKQGGILPTITGKKNA